MRIGNNGFIWIKQVCGGGYENGMPVKVSHTWSNPIEANIISLKYNTINNYSSGTFSNGSYLIFIDLIPLDANSEIRIECNERILGEFKVIDVQEKRRFGRLQIVV